jgi:hypothetical protein
MSIVAPRNEGADIEHCETQAVITRTMSRRGSVLHESRVLSRRNGFFHAFLSYQVASDSDKADALYNKLVCLAVQKLVQVPAPQPSYWPKEFKRSDACPVRIFYDKQCLSEGDMWEWNTSIDDVAHRAHSGGYIGALNKSIVVIPLVSVGVDEGGKLTGSIGRLFRYGYKAFYLAKDKIPWTEFKKGDTFWLSSRVARKNLVLFTRYKVEEVQPGSLTAATGQYSMQVMFEQSNARVVFYDQEAESRSESDCVSMTNVCLYYQTSNETIEGVDNVLFEWMYAYALMRINVNTSTTQPQGLHACRALYPIFYGSIISDLQQASSDSNIFDIISPLSSISKVAELLSPNIPFKIVQKIEKIFCDVQIASELPKGFLRSFFDDCNTFGVRSFVHELRNFQGFDFQSKLGSVDHLHVVSQKIFSCISLKFVDPRRFAMDKPMAQELVSFLDKSKAKYMLPVFASYNICSVTDLSMLDSRSLHNLADEISQSSQKNVYEVSLHLSHTVLRAKSSFLSQPLDVRLNKFTDNKLSLFTAATSKSAVDLLLGKGFFMAVTLIMAAGGAYSAALSYSSYGWEGNTISALILAIGCGSTSLASRFIHPRVGKSILAVMFTLIIASTIYGWYSSRDAGFGYCEKAQSTNRLLTDYETCDDYLFFAVLFIQLTLYTGGVFFVSIWQQYFWSHIFLVNSLLNVAYFIADTLIYAAPAVERAQDLMYACVCFALFLILMVSRRNFRLKARNLCHKDTLAHKKQWENLPATTRDDLGSFIRTRFAQYCDVTESASRSPPPLLQDVSNLQELYDRGNFINYTFQEWVESWFSKSSDVVFSDPSSKYSDSFKLDLSHILNVDVLRGPIKQPSRAISKIYRSYGGDVAKLTDVVRCTILCKEPCHLIHIAEAVLSRGCPAENKTVSRFAMIFGELFNFCSTDVKDDDSDDQDEVTGSAGQNHAAFVILRIRNRFDDSWTSNAEFADGYRDLSLKLLLAFEESDCGGCWFVPVANWARKKRSENGLHTMIVELQLKLKGSLEGEDMEKMHARYVKQRNLLSQ